jgi:hypothetical protein
MAVRRAGIAFVALVAVSTLAACGGNKEEVLVVSRAAENAFAPTSEVRPATGSVIDNLSQAETASSLKAVLEQLDQQRSEYDGYIADAICAGLAQLAEQGSDTNPSNDQWRDFIVGYLDRYAQAVVIGYSHSDVLVEVDRYLGAWDIAQDSPGLANFYVNAC